MDGLPRRCPLSSCRISILAPVTIAGLRPDGEMELVVTRNHPTGKRRMVTVTILRSFNTSSILELIDSTETFVMKISK